MEYELVKYKDLRNKPPRTAQADPGSVLFYRFRGSLANRRYVTVEIKNLFMSERKYLREE